MKESKRLAGFIPDAAALAAALTTVAAALLPVSLATKIEILAAAPLLMALGWLWTMHEQRATKREEDGRAARLLEEKVELERLLDAAINSQIAATADLDLKRTLRELAQTLAADLAACFTLEKDIGMLRPQPGAFGVGPGSLQDYMLGTRADDPVNRVVASGKPMLKGRSGGSSPRLLPKGFAAGAMLLTPMLVDGEVIGLLVVAAPEREKFSAKDVELAMATASSCGVALVKERVLNVSRRQLQHSTVIKEVALAVNSSLDLNQIMHLFLGKARGVIDYDRASVVLFRGGSYDIAAMVDAEGHLRRKLTTKTHGRVKGSTFEAALDGSLVKRTGLGVNQEYATEAPAELRLGATFSEVMVPLRSKGEVVGCVAFRGSGDNAFPETLHAVLYELANLGGMAITNSLAHAGAAQQARHLDLLLGSLPEVSRMLTATTEGPAALERRAVETVAGLFQSEVAVLTRVENGEHRVVAVHGGKGAGLSRADNLAVVTGAGLVGAVALQQGALRLSSATEKDLVPPLPLGNGELTCGLAAPMFVDGTLEGSLAVFGNHSYDDSETAVLSTVANQVAVALRNAELFHRSQRSLWELANLHEGLQAIAASLDMQEVLDSILKKAAAVSGAQIGSIMVLEEGRLQLRATYGTDGPTAESLTFGVGEGIAGKVVATGKPILANDVAKHPDFQQPPPEPGSIVPKALLCVPMQLGDAVIGVINLSNYLRTNVFDEDAVRVVSSLASQTSIAVQNARLYTHLQSERDRLISLEEVLRQDIARDLHDGPVQRLAGMAMNIEVIRTALSKDPERARLELQELDNLVRLTIKEARTMLFELRPLVLETQGLGAALESYAEQYEANNGISIELDVDEELGRLAPAVEQTMFSVAQEALGNIRKHAHATRVEVSLKSEGDTVVGVVRDNGDGFDVAETQANYDKRESQSLGLVNMTERAERVGGTFRIESAAGQGTTVTIVVPRRQLEVRSLSQAG
ncbi:MAG: GAF domain-containing protein [Candidatus Dormiibacterota bacterium]